jgi:hypothetical protein
MFDETSDWNGTLQIVGIVAACSWLACGIIYSCSSFVEWRTQSDGNESIEDIDAYDEGTGENEYGVVNVRQQGDQPSFTTMSLGSCSEQIMYVGQSKSWNFVSPGYYENEIEC